MTASRIEPRLAIFGVLTLGTARHGRRFLDPRPTGRREQHRRTFLACKRAQPAEKTRACHHLFLSPWRGRRDAVSLLRLGRSGCAGCDGGHKNGCAGCDGGHKNGDCYNAFVPEAPAPCVPVPGLTPILADSI